MSYNYYYKIGNEALQLWALSLSDGLPLPWNHRALFGTCNTYGLGTCINVQVGYDYI